MSDEDFSAALKRVTDGETLDGGTTTRTFAHILSGQVADADLAAFLTAFSKRKPTVAEIVGAARALRAAMTTVEAGQQAIDLCGTGGDNHGTLNVSTACAFVVAAAGVQVAKHGNRNMSSKSGTADVLEALGAKIDLGPEGALACLRQANLCFLFAQTYHPGMKHVAQVRRTLGFRTIFNLLGPLANPAKVKRQLIGVYAKDMLEPMAQALKELGADKAWIVHGGDGLDEMTTTDITHVAMLEGGRITMKDVSPRELGLNRATLSALKGGTAEENAGRLKKLLAGAHGAYRDIVLLNSAGALVVAGLANDLKTGAAMAAAAIDKGQANRTLDKFVAASRAAA
jgi:anthranilate phosphoribosyltransferase